MPEPLAIDIVSLSKLLFDMRPEVRKNANRKCGPYLQQGAGAPGCGFHPGGMVENSPTFQGWVILLLLLLSILTAPAASYKVLVFSATAGFRHDSITNGIAAIQALGSTNGFAVDATEDATAFSDANLAQYKAVVFLNTTGDVLTTAGQQTALQNFIRAGGGWVGIHSAADTLHNWSWYGGLVGAYFDSHPAVQSGTVKVIDPVDPSTRM